MKDLEDYAKENNVPIILKEGLNFLLDYIKENNVKSILEIGTAIGYSSINMAKLDKEIKVTTVELKIDMYNEAVKNINKYNLSDQIEVILANALDIKLDKKYDLIFIDAAKAQYIKFFEKFKCNLTENGVIICDNLLFHGLVAKKDEIESRNLKQLVTKIDKFVKFLKTNQEFNTTFYQVGDGISISVRR